MSMSHRTWPDGGFNDEALAVSFADATSIERAAFQLYGAAVAAARDPYLYATLGVSGHAGRAVRCHRSARLPG